MREKGKWPFRFTTLNIIVSGALWRTHGYCKAETESMICRFEKDRPDRPKDGENPEYSCKSKNKP